MRQKANSQLRSRRFTAFDHFFDENVRVIGPSPAPEPQSGLWVPSTHSEMGNNAFIRVGLISMGGGWSFAMSKPPMSTVARLT